MSHTDSTRTPSSTRPYLLRAIYEWCVDNGLTPYVAAQVDGSVQVPREHVKNNEIVLNISMDATSGLKLGNDYIEFKARFGGAAREIIVPIDHVMAIYARENGQGMAFPTPPLEAPSEGEDIQTSSDSSPAVLGQKRPEHSGASVLQSQAESDPKVVKRPAAKLVAFTAAAPGEQAQQALEARSDASVPATRRPAPKKGDGKPSLKRIK